MFHVVIPARYHSVRLPGKPLKQIGDQPMIAHVYQRAVETGAGSIVVASDDQRIADVVTALGGEIFLSDVDHQSGTERIAEVVAQRGYADDDIVVNLQGDEPFIPAKILQQVAAVLAANPQVGMASVYVPLDSPEDVFNPNLVKVVLDKNNYAIYFSRAPIPWLRDVFNKKDQNEFDLNIFHRHIGVYAYRASFIKEYIRLPVSPLEQLESLEQLRVLWNGHKIIMAPVEKFTGLEVNTPEDLEKAQKVYSIKQEG